jgi:hypothetical protein
MAIIRGPLQFTGTIGDMTAYRIKGSDKVILRQKAGPSLHRMKYHPAFENTRRNNEEWKPLVMAGREIRNALQEIRHIKDFNSSGILHKLCKVIQLMDTSHEKGKRPVLLSRGGAVLEGFSFNRSTPFESLLQHPLHASVDRQTGQAIVELPDILPGINFFNPSGKPLCRFVFMLGAASDILYNEDWHHYRPATTTLPRPAVLKTEWQPWQQKTEAAGIRLQADNWQPDTPAALLLSAGIEFGIPVTNSVIQYAKRSGSTKLLRVM